MSDKKTIMTWLEICGKNRDGSFCCPYSEENGEDETSRCREDLMADALELIKTQEEEIEHYIKKCNDLYSIAKSREEIVRCKDCVHATMTTDKKLCKYCELDTDDDGWLIEAYYDADWYCAGGEKKTEN